MAVNRRWSIAGRARSGIKRSALAVFALAAALFRLGQRTGGLDSLGAFARGDPHDGCSGRDGVVWPIFAFGASHHGFGSQLILAHYGAGRRRPGKKEGHAATAVASS